MASAACAMPSAASVKGTPCLSMAAPPTSAVLVSNCTFPFLLKKAIRRSTSAITSGPMPSPGSSKSACAVIALPGSKWAQLLTRPATAGKFRWAGQPSSEKRQGHRQREAVEHQQHAEQAQGAAQAEQRHVADDEMHRCQHDADLQQRLAPIEVGVLAQRHVPLDLQGLGLDKQFIKALLAPG